MSNLQIPRIITGRRKGGSTPNSPRSKSERSLADTIRRKLNDKTERHSHEPSPETSPRPLGSNKLGELDLLHQQILPHISPLPGSLEEYQKEVDNLLGLFHLAEKLYTPYSEFSMYNPYILHDSPCQLIRLGVAYYFLRHNKVELDPESIGVTLEVMSNVVTVQLPEHMKITYSEVCKIRKHLSA
jgi:hypothetical protein